jgi:hypothetical protein
VIVKRVISVKNVKVPTLFRFHQDQWLPSLEKKWVILNQTSVTSCPLSVASPLCGLRGLCAMLPPSIRFPRVIHSHHRQLFQNLRGLSSLCDLCAMLLPSTAFPHVIHFTSPSALSNPPWPLSPSVTSLHRQKVLAIIEFSSISRLQTLSAPTTPPQICETVH